MSTSKLRAVLQLCRIPNVFTAMSNVVAGVVLARGGEFHLADLQLVGALFDLDLPAVGPASFEGRITDAPASLRSEGSVRIGRTQFTGYGALKRNSGARPRALLHITSPHIYIADLTPVPPSTEPDASDWTLGTWLLGHEPIEFDTKFAADASGIPRGVVRGHLEVPGPGKWEMDLIVTDEHAMRDIDYRHKFETVAEPDTVAPGQEAGLPPD